MSYFSSYLVVHSCRVSGLIMFSTPSSASTCEELAFRCEDLALLENSGDGASFISLMACLLTGHIPECLKALTNVEIWTFSHNHQGILETLPKVYLVSGIPCRDTRVSNLVFFTCLSHVVFKAPKKPTSRCWMMRDV